MIREWRADPSQTGPLARRPARTRTVVDVPDQDTGQAKYLWQFVLKIFSRSANREQCQQNCPEKKKKKKKKNGSNNKKNGKKGNNKNRGKNKKNKRIKMKGEKTSNKERSSEPLTSRYEETKLDDESKTEAIEDFGPFGNFFKSLVDN